MGITVGMIQQAKTAKQLIAYRPQANNQQTFTMLAAETIVRNKDILKEVQANPELMIEILFFVVDKNKKTVPFVLNEVQRDFIATLNKAIAGQRAGKRNGISLLVLKGRQQGFTTLITAYQLAMAITRRNFEGMTIADDSDNAQVIFDAKAKFIYNALPQVCQPTAKYNNRRELRFEKLNSYLSVDVATKNIGRSRTVNFLHASECAFWRDGIATIQAGLGEALTPDCIKIYESTANGMNDYREMWHSGAHINLFYEWWRTTEYTAVVPKGWTIPDDDSWIAKRLRWLKGIDLTEGQIYWYYHKWLGYIDKALIKQEYPCTPEEAFIASGRPVFDTEAIQGRIHQLQGAQHKKIGYNVTYNDPDSRDKIIKHEEHEGGFITIYEKPQPGIPYVLGGDTAGEGSDAYTAYILRNDTGAQVASLHMPLNSADCTPYIEQIYALGKEYNDAMIAVEINFNLQPVAELQRLKYPRIYVRQRVDTYTKAAVKQYGFKTDGNTRPMIITLLSSVIAEHIDWIEDIELLRECLSFEYDDKGRPDARAGTHDDRIFAAAIAYKAREQQSYSIAKTSKTVYVPQDIYDDYIQADEADQVAIQKRYGGMLAVKGAG